MDLNPVGKHCALESCSALDFLPIQCGCSRWFCRLHILPDLHSCPTLQRHDPTELAPSSSPRSKCTHTGCDKPSLPAIVSAQCAGCSGCQLSFCVDHRHISSHACDRLTVRSEDVKHETARAILARVTAAGILKSSHTPVVSRQPRDVSVDPKKLAQLQKVNLMKMRHKAVPGDPKDKGSSVPIDERLHVNIRLEIAGQPANESVLWFRKVAITGKVLDLVTEHFGLSHAAIALHLKHSRTGAKDEVYILQNHLPLSTQLVDGTTVLLTDEITN